jgi:hypothetical protein
MPSETGKDEAGTPTGREFRHAGPAQDTRSENVQGENAGKFPIGLRKSPARFGAAQAGLAPGRWPRLLLSGKARGRQIPDHRVEWFVLGE